MAGRRPFSGQTTSDILAAILEHEIEPIARVDPAVPSELTRIIGKSLRKDPEQRYQVMKDLLLDLQALRRGDRGSADNAVVCERPSDGSMGWAALQLWIAAIAWYSHLAVATVSLAAYDRAYEAAGRGRRPVDRPLTRLTFDPGLQTDAAFSPDGRSIAYASDRAGNFDIWVRPLDGGEADRSRRRPRRKRSQRGRLTARVLCSAPSVMAAACP